ALSLLRGDRWVPVRAEPAGRHLPGEVPVHRAGAGGHEELLQLRQEAAHLLLVARVRRLAAWQGETERDVGHPSTVRVRACPSARGTPDRVTVMQRRGVTVLVGAIIVAVLTAGVMAAPVPYVILDPGPTVDTLGERDGKPVIQITGTPTSTSKGQLRLTTVGVDPDVNLLTAIRAWFDDEEAVVPRELIYPPDKSPEEVEEQNERQFTQSQNSAEVAALRYLGYPAQVVVREVPEGMPAHGRLRAGDVITSVDGTEVTSVEELQELVTRHPAGTTLEIGYLR